MAEEIKSESEKKKEDWMNSKWRPMMGWMYMAVCTFDFMVAPILWSLVQTLGHGSVNTQWQPLTLQGAGLFHVAMGAVLGIAAFGRTQEKLAGANNGGLPTGPSGMMGTSYTPPTGMSNVPPSMSPTSSIPSPISMPTPSVSPTVPTPSFARPTPAAFAPQPINTPSGLHPDDPPVRNTRNDL